MKTTVIIGMVFSFFWAGAVLAEDAPPSPELGVYEGSVTIDCAVKPNGRLKDCKILKEVPEGHGYGEATIKLFVRNACVASKDRQEKIPVRNLHINGQWM
jgi:hypothetical protein